MGRTLDVIPALTRSMSEVRAATGRLMTVSFRPVNPERYRATMAVIAEAGRTPQALAAARRSAASSSLSSEEAMVAVRAAVRSSVSAPRRSTSLRVSDARAVAATSGSMASSWSFQYWRSVSNRSDVRYSRSISEMCSIEAEVGGVYSRPSTIAP